MSRVIESEDREIILFLRFDAIEPGRGDWAFSAMAKSSNGGKSSIRPKSFNSKGFSRIVKMLNFNGETKLLLLKPKQFEVCSLWFVVLKARSADTVITLLKIWS